MALYEISKNKDIEHKLIQEIQEFSSKDLTRQDLSKVAKIRFIL